MGIEAEDICVDGGILPGIAALGRGFKDTTSIHGPYEHLMA